MLHANTAVRYDSGVKHYIFLPLDQIAALLLVTKRSQIIANRIYMRPPLMSPVVSGSSIVTVDFDRVASKIYWADASQKKIWRSNENGTDRQEVREMITQMYSVKTVIFLSWPGFNMSVFLGILHWFNGAREYSCGLGGSEPLLDRLCHGEH